MMPMVPQLKRLMVPLPMMIMVLRVLLIMTMLRAQLLLILMVPQLKSLMVPQLMMLMVLQLVMTMLMKVQLLTHMVPQLMMPMVPQQKKNMVLQLTMMFLPQNTAMLPDADVPDLATLADLPQLGLTETETVQLPEDQLVDDQLHKPLELEDSLDQLPRHQEDKLVPNNSKHQDVDVVEVLSPSPSLTEVHKEMPSPSDKLENN